VERSWVKVSMWVGEVHKKVSQPIAEYVGIHLSI
jgi:hypothetical protein